MSCKILRLGRMLCVAVHLLFLMTPSLTAQRSSMPPASQPPPGTMFLYPERIPLRDGTLAEAERGLLFVPMVRSDTSRGVVSVEIWRFRAQHPSGRPPIFRLPGGPGFEGLDEDLRDGYYEDVVRPYIEVADYVVIGQRGIGPSKPNTLCADSDGGPAEFSRACREFWETKGLDVRGFNVIEAAADVRDAAAALGYEQIVLRGGSFGSHWAMAVMRYHSDLVAWSVLSGTEGPDHTYDAPTGILRALERIAATAERDSGLSPFIPPGGLLAALETVRARLAVSPVRVVVTDSASGETQAVTFTEDDVRGWSTGYTRGLGSRRGAAAWPEDILRLYYGEFGPIARRLVERLSEEEQTVILPSSTASEFLLDCASGASPERLEALESDPAQTLVFEEYTWYQEICGPWDVDVGDSFRRDFATDVPTVIVHGTWDVNTPLDNALELLPRFGQGKLVKVVGGSHGALGEAISLDPAFSDAFWTYLATGNVAVMPDSVLLPPVEWLVSARLKELVSGANPNR